MIMVITNTWVIPVQVGLDNIIKPAPDRGRRDYIMLPWSLNICPVGFEYRVDIPNNSSLLTKPQLAICSLEGVLTS